MSAETRVVRPYAGGTAFQRVLDKVQLRHDGRLHGAENRIEADLDGYLNGLFTLVFDPPGDEVLGAAASELDIDLVDIDLLVLVSAPRLRITEIAFRSPVDQLRTFPESIEITRPQRPKALCAPHGGADITTYFCLNRSLDPRPLRPWRLGTWLGRQEFRVRTDLSGSGFVPVKLTPGDRERFGLPEDATHYVTLEDTDPFDPEPGPTALRLHIDEELLDRLAIATSSKVGRHIQRRMFMSAIEAVVFAALEKLRENPEAITRHVDDFAGSLLHRVVSMAGGRGTDDAARRQELFRRLLRDPALFLMDVETMIGSRRELLDLLEDDT